MSHLSPGLMPVYNSLTDKHLAGYFSNTRIRRHLQRAGLITRSGRIVPDKEYRHKLMQRAHQRHVRECLAQAIFHKVLEMERLHQIEIKRRLEESARRERVLKIKVERSKRYEEDIIRILSPRPPTGSRSVWKQHSGPERDHSESSDSPSSSRPNTAPGKMQRPVRLKPIHSNSTTASLRRSSPYRTQASSQENNQPLSNTMDIKSRRHLTAKEVSQGISPYCLPVINNFVTPVPPVARRNDRGSKVILSSTVRGRRLRPTTASSGPEDPPWLRSSVYQSRVRVSMVYFGKTVHLSNDLIDTRDDIRVFQQHCGGENLCVYKGKLREGDAFQFISRRHRGFPFSLTFYLNGLQVERLSSCCEFKHRKGSRLGGRHGHFGFASVEGASPCYKCIIAMGLDKKPTPPPKTLRGDQSQEQSASSLQDEPEMEADRTGGGAASHLERESSQTPKMETAVEEEPAPVESKVKDAYEEDFEADDEGPVEEATLQEEKPPSSLGKTEKQDQKADGSEAEDEEFDEDKTSCSGSSVSGSDEAETDGETTKHSEEDEKEDKAEENDQTEAAASASEKDTWKSEETAASRAQAASVNNSDMLDSAGDSTGLEISDTSVLTGNENELSNDPSENKNVEHAGDEIKNEDEQERAKSVQEKLAEAILKESQCSSEPELSDTSTEEEEGPADKANKKENEEQLMTPAEAMNHEESVTNEVVEEQIKFTEAEEEKDMELDYCDNTQEERPSEVGEEEKAADDESRTEGDKSEEPGEEQPPVDGENVAQDDKIEDPFEGSESADVEAPHNDEDKVEKDAAEPDTQQDETGPRAKSGDTDESPGLEPNEEADKATVPDIAEAEAAATSETMETKAESSEEQEALSCEEAPEPGTEKMQTDSEEAQITAENSSRLPEECGDSTAEKTADVHVETAKSHSSNEETEGETKQQVAGAEEGEDGGQQENCRMGEESVEVNEAPEKHSLTNSEEITEAENKAEENHDDTKADASIEQNKNPPEGTECQDIPDENKDEISDTEKDDEGEGVEGEINLGGPEAKVDDKGQAGEEESETKVLQEKEDEAEISENVENDRIKESKTEEESEDTSKNSVAEEIETSEITEEPEKSQDADLDTQKVKMSSENTAESENVSENKEADGTETHEPTPDVTYSETEKTEAERESERGEVDAENGEGSFAAECEPREDEEKALSADEKRQAEEPDEEFESAEVNEVAGDNVEKQEDSLTDPAPETGITESDAKEGDGSMVKHDEAVNRDSEPDVQDEKNGIEEEEAVKDDNEESNLTPNNIEGDDGEVSPLGEIPSAPTAAADVEETANQEDEGKPESVTEKPLETVENGEDAEEASKASEEGASVLLKPPAQNTEAEDAVGEGIPEVLARDNGADMVTNWIQMHQTSKFFETFVEPLEDLRNEVPNAQVSHLKAEEMESADLLRPESPTKMGRTSRDGETEESRDETQESRGEADQCENDSAEGAPQGSEETSKKSLEINKETDQHDSRGSHEDNKESGEGNTAFTTEVEAFSGSLKAGSDFENRSSENVNSDEGLILKQAATDLSSKPEPSNSLNEQKDTDDTWDNISRDERQITQVTNFTTSHSADGSQEESHDEEAQTKMPEQSFSGETRDMQLIEDIKHTLSKEHLSTFSLFGHTSYPLLTTSGSDGGQ